MQLIKWLFALISFIDLSFFIEITFPEYVDWDVDEDFLYGFLMVYVVSFINLLAEKIGR